MKLNKAQREQVKLRLGISGPSGYGKSYSALLLAYGITQDWTKIAVIDTENNSASLYSHLGDYNVLSLNEPYSPERYIEAVKTCENASMEVIIIDSITHEWTGKGGCLQLHEQLGGRFQDWAKITPRHQAFLDAILESKSHVIVTTRRKIDYSLDADANGRTRVVKHGTKEITREGLEYELTVNLELINDKHLVRASKDRTGLFMDKPEFVISSSTGKRLVRWCQSGVTLEQVRNELDKAKTVDELKSIYGRYVSFQKEIYPYVLDKKKDLEKIAIVDNSQIIQSKKTNQNGTYTNTEYTGSK